MCLRTSQLVAALRDFLPQTALKECETRWGGVADPRFLVEGAAGDLVSATEQCLVDPLWKVSVSMILRCTGDSRLTDAEHRLKIVFHHRQLDDTDLGRRVRRELKNQSPYFEQSFYVAAVEEEKDPGVYVTSVRARDPENGAVRYSMNSLIDARSQALLALDPVTGKVTTRARLDRENVDVHYFRVCIIITKSKKIILTQGIYKLHKQIAILFIGTGSRRFLSTANRHDDSSGQCIRRERSHAQF